MKNYYRFLVCSMFLVVYVPNLCIGSQLFFYPTAGSFDRSSYNGAYWENVTAHISATFDSVTELHDLSDLSLLLSHDALWLNHQFGSQSLSDIEKQNIETFINSGRKVLMVGENSNWTIWNNIILSFVGGKYTDGYSYGLAIPVIKNELTEGVDDVWIGGGGLVASGEGTPLFSKNFATLWGDNVISILDTNVFDDAEDQLYIGWGNTDTELFIENTIDWLGQPVPEPCTLALLGLGAILAGRKRGK